MRSVLLLFAVVALALALPACAEEATDEPAAEESDDSGDGGDDGGDGGDDEDTGRMSDTEFDRFSQALAGVDSETEQFGTTLQRCGVLFQALELAEGSACVGEAYSGFEDKALLAYAEADDLKGDVAKDCLRLLTRYQTRVEGFATYVSALHQAGANLQAGEFQRLARRATKRIDTYRAARDRVLVACEPG